MFNIQSWQGASDNWMEADCREAIPFIICSVYFVVHISQNPLWSKCMLHVCNIFNIFAQICGRLQQLELQLPIIQEMSSSRVKGWSSQRSDEKKPIGKSIGGCNSVNKYYAFTGRALSASTIKISWDLNPQTLAVSSKSHDSYLLVPLMLWLYRQSFQ